MTLRKRPTPQKCSFCGRIPSAYLCDQCCLCWDGNREKTNSTPASTEIITTPELREIVFNKTAVD